jgi:hypothetical protein
MGECHPVILGPVADELGSPRTDDVAVSLQTVLVSTVD